MKYLQNNIDGTGKCEWHLYNELSDKWPLPWRFSFMLSRKLDFFRARKIEDELRKLQFPENWTLEKLALDKSFLHI